MVTWDDVPADIPAHEINKHFSLMSCVNAEGKSVEPLMMIQGARLLECYANGWPECNICMSESGYMTKEAFYSWGIKWEEKTRPPLVLMASGAPGCSCSMATFPTRWWT